MNDPESHTLPVSQMYTSYVAVLSVHVPRAFQEHLWTHPAPLIFDLCPQMIPLRERFVSGHLQAWEHLWVGKHIVSCDCPAPRSPGVKQKRKENSPPKINKVLNV